MKTTIDKTSFPALKSAFDSAFNSSNVGYEVRLVKADLSETRLSGAIQNMSGLLAIKLSDKSRITVGTEDNIVLYIP
jgi:hypothetical protein